MIVIDNIELNYPEPHRFKGCLTLKDFYKTYKKANPRGSDFYVTYTDYIKIWECFVDKFNKSLLEEAYDIRLPYRLGVLTIKKSKLNINKPLIDYKATREAGMKVYHMNEHSRGYRYMFNWKKSQCIVPNKAAYKFLPTRTLKRELARLIKEKRYDYPEI